MKCRNLAGLVVVVAGLFNLPGLAIADDVYPVLTTLDGSLAFTNARISSHTMADAVVIGEGKARRVPFTNLPIAIQQQYHFDPAKAAAQQSAAKAIAEQQAAANATVGDPFLVKIAKCTAPGQYQVQISSKRIIPGRESREIQKIVSIPNLPYKIVQFVNRFNSLSNDLYHPPAGSFDNTTRMLMAQKRSEMQEEFEQMQSLQEDTTTITVGKTSSTWLGLPVWKYMGDSTAIETITAQARSRTN